MEEAIENQPHCEDVAVSIREEELAAAIEAASAGYVELTGRLLDVTIVVAYEGVTGETEMAMEEGYPLMSIVDVAGSE